MNKTLKNWLARLSLQLQNPSLEQDYVSACSGRILQRPLLYLTILIACQLAIMLIVLEHYSPALIVMQSCAGLLTILLFFLRKKSENRTKLLVTSIACLLNVISFLHLRNHLPTVSPLSAFGHVYIVTIVQNLLGMLILRFKFIIIAQLFSFVSRAWILYCDNTLISKECQLMLGVSIFVDLLWLYFAYNRELDDRKFFEKVSASNERNPYFQLVDKMLPHGILILDDSLTTEIYMNQSFKEMVLQDVTKGNLKQGLNMLSVSKDDFPLDNDLYGLFEKRVSMTLYEFLMQAGKAHRISHEPVTVYASYISRGKTQKLIEVKILQLNWQGRTSIAVILNDIEPQKDIILQKLSNGEKDRLINTISHELKTPIHGILTMLMVAQDTIQSPEALSVFNFCKKNTLLLLSFVSSILDLQLIRSNRLKLKMNKVNLETLLKETISLFELHCSQKNLILDYDIEKEVPEYVYTDQERLSQVLVTLVGNAIKFTYQGGINIKVKVGAQEKNENSAKTVFEIVDTGLGISEKKQEKLFKMYENKEEDHVRDHGAGLGLTISNYIVQALGRGAGNEGIKCMSKLNEGSTFSFSIPNEPKGKMLKLPHHGNFSDFFREEIEDSDVELRLSPYNQKKPDPSRTCDHSKISISGIYDFDDGHFLRTSARKNSGVYSNTNTLATPVASSSGTPFEFGRRKKGREISLVVTPPEMELMMKKRKVGKLLNACVLLVDDNPLNLLVGKKIIEDTGCQVKTAINGEDAIAKVKEQATASEEFFKLILMDCQMPVMDGYEATKELKALMERKEIPGCQIVALTANDSEEDIQRCKDSGMDEVLSKPLKEQKLHEVLEGLKENK